MRKIYAKGTDEYLRKTGDHDLCRHGHLRLG